MTARAAPNVSAIAGWSFRPENILNISISRGSGGLSRLSSRPRYSRPMTQWFQLDRQLCQDTSRLTETTQCFIDQPIENWLDTNECAVKRRSERGVITQLSAYLAQAELPEDGRLPPERDCRMPSACHPDRIQKGSLRPRDRGTAMAPRGQRHLPRKPPHRHVRGHCGLGEAHQSGRSDARRD